MKRTIMILCALLLSCTALRAQNIALGQRTPELRVGEWLEGRQPAAAPLTYIEFFHSSSPRCAEALDRLAGLQAELGNRLRVVVLTREAADKAAPLLAPRLSPRFGVGLDPQGKLFAAFGVNYVPFGVLVDAKGRALWMGNTLQLTRRIIEDSAK